MRKKLVAILVLSVWWTNQARADLVPAIDYTGGGPTASFTGTYGYSFNVLNNPLIVDALAVNLPVFPDGPNQYKVRLWQEGTTTTIASATMNATSPVSSTTHPYRYEAITPVTLLANTTYDIALDDTGNQILALQVTGVSNNPDITFGQARSSATMGQFPTTDAVGFGPYFGPSFEASPVPEPTSFALVGMGVGAVILAYRRRKKNQHATQAA